jgi:hypothetical protein
MNWIYKVDNNLAHMIKILLGELKDYKTIDTSMRYLQCGYLMFVSIMVLYLELWIHVAIPHLIGEGIRFSVIMKKCVQ